jgi:hypothetical protein
VVLINGAQDCNVAWQVGSSATIGTGTTFVGNIVALTSITMINAKLISVAAGPVPAWPRAARPRCHNRA